MNLSTLLGLAALLSLTACTTSQPFVRAQPETVGLSSDSLAQMDAHFHRLVDEQQLAGIQTAVLCQGKLVHFDSYGLTNIAEGTALDQQSLFRIFSMTKPLVSVALMQLYEQGKFQLDDPLHQYLPDFKAMQVYTDTGLVPVQQPIRIVDLLRHTSGFSYGRTPYPALNQRYAEAQLNTATTNQAFVQKLSQLPLQFEPGTDWQYGLSTNICGHLVEVLSGQSLDIYLKEHLLDPLGMTNTYFQVPKDKIEHFTVGYGWQDSLGLTIVEPQRDNRYTRPITLFNGGGGLVSTTLDYLKFCQMILQKGQFNGQQLLKPATIDLMLQDQLQEVRQHQTRLRLPQGESGFGLGFAIRGPSANALEKVYGWGGAVGTYFKIDRTNNLIYVLMIQRSPYRPLGLRRLFQQYVEAALLG